MSAYEIMLSESQERMLLVTEPQHEEKVRAIFSRWGLEAVAIGAVTGDGILRARQAGKVVAEIPSRALTDEAPVYQRPLRRPAYLDEVNRLDEDSVPAPSDWQACVRALVASPNLCRKRWIWEQYDHMVRTNTVIGPGGDAAVLRIKGSPRLLALSTDCNPRLCYLDPREGARAAVAEACRNITCAGGEPLAATNCLNFASPENPEVMWQFASSVDGIREACEAMGTPITGGNVSFYNETNGAGVFPTPVIGMVGVVEKESHVTPAGLQSAGDTLLLLGSRDVSLAGSEYLEIFHDRVAGQPVPVDLAQEIQVQDFLRACIREGWVRSAHDCSEGGLLAAVLESAFLSGSGLGFDLELRGPEAPHRALFGEGPARILLSVGEEFLARVRDSAMNAGVPLLVCGQAVPDTVRVRYNGEDLLSMTISEIHALWKDALEGWFRS